VTPTVIREGPYRFFFYSGDRTDPAHVHVEHDNEQAKFWLAPVSLAANHGFSPKAIRKIEAIVVVNQATLLESWNEFFTD
jgi:uncharacterized protein DUF4160